MKLIWGSLGMVLLLWSVAGHAARWQTVPDGSSLVFAARYEGQEAPGAFHRFDAELYFDPAQPQRGRLRVMVDLTSVDMFSADINEEIRQPQWLDVAGKDRATFDSERIDRVGEGRYLAHGRLHLKGETRMIEVPFTWRGAGGSGLLEGEAMVQRTAFDIGTGEWAAPSPIGADVVVRYRVTFRRAD